MTQRQIMTNHFVCLENFCENLCLHNGILSMQQITKKQIRLNLCDLLWRQNSVAATKIFTKILQYTRSDLLLQCVASPCCNLSPSVYRPLNKSQCMAFFVHQDEKKWSLQRGGCWQRFDCMLDTFEYVWILNSEPIDLEISSYRFASVADALNLLYKPLY